MEITIKLARDIDNSFTGSDDGELLKVLQNAPAEKIVEVSYQMAHITFYKNLPYSEYNVHSTWRKIRMTVNCCN